MDALDVARFWSSVAVLHVGKCWLWRGYCDTSGYGSIKIGGKPVPAHRAAYLAAFGEIPDGAIVRHICDHPLCCTPTHLLTGTHADNVRDRVIRKRTAIGERASKAKLTESDVRAIRASAEPLRKLAARYGVTSDAIQAIRYRRSWKHVA
jgi:hypothetical protein